MTTIQQTLDRFESLRLEDVELFSRLIEAIVHAVPPEYADTVRGIGAEFAERQETLPQEMDQIEAELKAHVLTTGTRLVGRFVQFSPTVGRTTWDGDKLETLALTYPEVATCKKTGEPYVRMGPLAVRRKAKPGIMFDLHIG